MVLSKRFKENVIRVGFASAEMLAAGDLYGSDKSLHLFGHLGMRHEHRPVI